MSAIISEPFAVVKTDTLAELIQTSLVDGSVYSFSNNDGSIAIPGGIFQYEANTAKSLHDGLNYISPTVLLPSVQTDGTTDAEKYAAWEKKLNEQDFGGNGVFKRLVPIDSYPLKPNVPRLVAESDTVFDFERAEYFYKNRAVAQDYIFVGDDNLSADNIPSAYEATENLITNPDFTGAVVGVKGAGGALPTGWTLSVSAVNWEVVAADSTSFTFKVWRNEGETTSKTGLRFPITAPAKIKDGLVFQCQVEVIEADNVDRIYTMITRGGSSAGVTRSDHITDGAAHLRSWTLFEAAESIHPRIDYYNLNGAASDSAYSITYKISYPVLQQADDIYDFSSFLTGSSIAKDLVVKSFNHSNTLLLCRQGMVVGSGNTITVSPNTSVRKAIKQVIGDPDIQVLSTQPLNWVEGNRDSVIYNGLVFGLDRNVDQYFSLQREEFYSNIFRFETRSDSRPSSDPSTKNRSELSRSANKLTLGTDYWIAFSFIVEDGVPFTGEWFSVFQLHGGDTAPNPPIMLDISNDNLKLIYGSSNLTYTSGGLLQLNVPIEKLRRNFIYNVVFKINAQNPSVGLGHLGCWINGETVIDEAVYLGWNADQPYPKFGIYKEQSDDTYSMLMSNIEIETTSLAARVTEPLPFIRRVS